MAQIFTVLMWKTYILRKRRWIISLLEIIIPIMLFSLLAYLKNLMPKEEEKILYDSPEKFMNFTFIDTFKVAYTPANDFTNDIMNKVFQILTTSGSSVKSVAKNTEDECVQWLKQEYVDETKNSTSDFGYTSHTPGVGVIFLDTDSTRPTNLRYILRTTTNNIQTNQDSLYGEQSRMSFYAYEFSGFTTIQRAVDQAYLDLFYSGSGGLPNNVFLGGLPSIQYGIIDLLQNILPSIVIFGFTYIMPSLLRGLVEEKTSGIKEMMKIMGLKSWVNWINWFAYSMFVYVPVLLIITIIITRDAGSGPTIEVNFFTLYIFFLLFASAFITLIFAMSTLFTNGTIAVICCEILWYVVSMLLNSFFVNKPDEFSMWIKVITCLWPSVSLLWGLKTIINFQKNGTPWTLSNLFDDGAGGGRVSVGLAAIMLCIDIALYSVITWYLDNVRPGPYGRAKPLTFIFQCFGKEEYNSKSSHVTGYQKNYEVAPSSAKVGLRIENLRKTFSRGKVVAIDNVDLDIYEGNITALLGHNGAGKTTTMSILCGFFTPSRGKVIVRGKNIFDNMDEFRSSLGLCPQHNLVFSFFTVLEHLLFFGMLKGLTMHQSEQEGMQLLRLLKIDGKKNELVSKLSGGMKRKLCLAIALMGDPEVLMLDEPTSGLDPESRRQVWDMLLGFRGHRTIVITTHFMEEADVLGDRIAIMDHGQVSCYGTSMFLKKVYGTGYHLNITKLEQAPVPPITRVIEEQVSTAGMKILSPSLLTYNIKSNESPRFPDLFSALDSWRTELGLTGLGLTCTTMEDVFLKVAEEPEKDIETNGNLHSSYFIGKHKKVTGCNLLLLQFRALVLKKILTRIRTKCTSLVFVIIPVLLMAYTVNSSMKTDFSADQPNLQISLASFPNVHVAVSSSDQTTTDILKGMVDAGKATFESIPSGSDLNNYMANKINNSLIQYERQMIAGFSYSSTTFLGGYSQYFVHSYPLVINMLSNTLLYKQDPSSSITVFSHPISFQATEDICDLSMLAASHVFLFPMIMTFLSLGMMILIMNFISFPLKERVSNAKQLQLMTGVSPMLYWITMFITDMIIYIITAVLMLSTVEIFQSNRIYTASGYMYTLVAVFLLFGISGIAYAYFFSFLVKSTVKASVLFIIINMMTGTIASVFLSLLGRITSDYSIFIYLLSFNPIFAVTSALIHLFRAMYINGTCIQCGKGCTTEDPLQFHDTGLNAKHPNGIFDFLVYLAIDAVLYFTLVMIIEYGIAKKLWYFVSKLWIKMDCEIVEVDADVLVENEKVKASESVRGYISNTSVLRVLGLAKKYNRKTTAVQRVTFQVGQGECFGLLGVNGAGKSTTFKMLTGEEIPNKGDASILQCSLHKHKSKFLAKIGYCPQFDAINKGLTGKEMLHIYAMLRGILPSHCCGEVNRWVQIMGLKEFADRPCGTYSGGNKRKLSIAMAFIGEPPVVFLDEPTSGVDPVSRRKLWDVVAQCQQAGQAIVLTSHSMEECEALCSRLTIMVAGQMKCIGSAQHLKQKFGEGYTIIIKLFPSQQMQLAVGAFKRDMVGHFRGCAIKDEHLGLLHYHIPDPTLRLSDLFMKMEHLKTKHDIIEDYNVSDTTLEQIFMTFARAGNRLES